MTVTISGTTGITSVNGTAGAPSMTGTDTDTGIVYGTNTMSLATGGTTAVTVNSSQNVGIGTSSPVVDLDVTKTKAGANVQLNVKNADSGATSAAYIFASQGSVNAFMGVYGNSTAYFGTASGSNYPVAFNVNGTERMRIDTNGIVTGTAGNLMLVSGTAVTSTSGTSITFTSIPSWVKRITVMFNSVSTNSNSNPVKVQIGSGSLTTTGYVAVSNYLNQANATQGATRTDCIGFITYTSGAGAADVISGQLVLTNLSGNLWVASGTFRMGTSLMCVSAGDVTLSGTIDRVGVVIGLGAFDAGSINIMYE